MAVHYYTSVLRISRKNLCSGDDCVFCAVCTTEQICALSIMSTLLCIHLLNEPSRLPSLEGTVNTQVVLRPLNCMYMFIYHTYRYWAVHTNKILNYRHVPSWLWKGEYLTVLGDGARDRGGGKWWMVYSVELVKFIFCIHKVIVYLHIFK